MGSAVEGEQEKGNRMGGMNLMKLHPRMDMTFSEWAAMMIAWPIAWIIGAILVVCMRGESGTRKAKR